MMRSSLVVLLCWQGSSDNFLEKDLTPDRLVAAAKSNGKLEVNLRMQQVRTSMTHAQAAML